GLQHAPRGLQDIPAAAIVGTDSEMQGVVCGSTGLGGTDQFLQPRLERGEIAHDVETHALGVELVDFLFKGLHEQPHEQRHFFLRPPPVLGTERKQGEIAHAPPATDLDHAPYRLHPAHVSGRARQKTLCGPPPVAIHDDRQMAWHRGVFRYGKSGTGVHHAGAGMTAQTVMISASFWLTTLSISPTYLSVSF